LDAVGDCIKVMTGKIQVKFFTLIRVLIGWILLLAFFTFPVVAKLFELVPDDRQASWTQLAFFYTIITVLLIFRSLIKQPQSGEKSE